jgi:hypothetical protein
LHVEVFLNWLDFLSHNRIKEHFSGGHMDVVKLLVESGADLCARKLDKSTPLHDVSWSGNTALAQYIMDEILARHKISRLDTLKAQNNMGETALHIASKRGHPQTIRFFLTVGDVAHIKDARGKLAHELATNRRTFLAFPETSDPIDRQCEQVGVMSSDRLLPETHAAAAAQQTRPPKPQVAAGQPQAAHPAAGAAPEEGLASSPPPAGARPRTSDVGNFTLCLGIRSK